MRENSGLPLLSEKFMGIEFINELHWNQGCGHKKVHVAPHIGFP